MFEHVVLIGFFGSLVAGLGTALGALGVFGLRGLSQRTEDILLASAAGVMLAASFFSLIDPGLAAAAAEGAPMWQAALMVIFGIALGATAVWAAEPLMPVILGFAAGAMLYIISHEIIPETHRSGHATRATFALLAGFAGMMLLDATFE